MDHILVIDNKYDIRNFLHEALSPIGYEVKGACECNCQTH
jgi:CheY-like chemotaxis protein